MEAETEVCKNSDNYEYEICALRYSHLDLNGASTWAFTESSKPNFNLNEIIVRGNAHLAFMSHVNTQTNVDIFGDTVSGDKTGEERINNRWCFYIWSDFAAILAYGMMLSICLFIRLTSTFLLTFVLSSGISNAIRPYRL